MKELEEICITDPETRELKETYKQRKRNTLAMKPELKTIDTDRRKYKLFVFKNSTEKLQIGKIRANQTRKKIFKIKHWREKENIKPNENIIKQYKGCEQDQVGKN
ncbi:40513_t:CDS:1, partial [Gigaspora margarita]